MTQRTVVRISTQGFPYGRSGPMSLRDLQW